MIVYLLEEEEEHIRIFEKLIDKKDADALDNREDDVLSIVDTEVFALPGDATSVEDLDKAIQLGINIEKRSLAFYLEIAKHTESEQGRNALKKIIGEEKKHWEELKKLAA